MELGGRRGIRTHGSRWVPGATIFKSGHSTSLTWAFVLRRRLSPRIPRGLPCTVGHGWTDSGFCTSASLPLTRPAKVVTPGPAARRTCRRPHDFLAGRCGPLDKPPAGRGPLRRRPLIVQVGVGQGPVWCVTGSIRPHHPGPAGLRRKRWRPGPRLSPRRTPPPRPPESRTHVRHQPRPSRPGRPQACQPSVDTASDG
jgi:hypothetical protein